MSDSTARTTADFFVSYTQRDRSWAEWLAWQLEAHGYSVIIQAWDFTAGQNFVLEMDRASARSARTIAVLSAEYLQSRFAAAEWTAALAKDPRGDDRTLIPVRVSEAVPSGLLASIGWVDLVDCDEDTALTRLLAAATGTRAKPAQKPSFPGTATDEAPSKPRFPAALPAIWNVPARNRNFTGRADLLSRLHPELASGDRVVVTQTIAGLGGVGKTQLAVEYAYRHAADYDVVWWIHAESEETRRADLIALARRLSIPDIDTLAPSAAVAALRADLERRGRWLLVFDNAEDPSDIEAVMPRAGAGHVLVTSRNTAWGVLAQVVRLDVWTPEEAARYLVTRTGEDNHSAAADLAQRLGFLPLAIEQAAAYIDESRISLGQYSAMFDSSRAKLLRASRSKVTVATIWSLSLHAVERASTDAVTLLHLLAFLPPDGFARERLLRPPPALPRVVATLLASEMCLNEAIAVLRRYSLIDATPEAVSVHRLVQAVVKDALANDQHRLFSEAAHALQHGTGDVPEEGLAADVPTDVAPAPEQRAVSEPRGRLRAAAVWSLLASSKPLARVTAAGVVLSIGIGSVLMYRRGAFGTAAVNGGAVAPLTNDSSAEIVSWVDQRPVTNWDDEVAKRGRAIAAYLNDEDATRARQYGFRAGQNPRVAWTSFQEGPVGFDGLPYVLFKTILDLDPEHENPALRSIARLWKRQPVVPNAAGSTAWTFDHLGLAPHPADYLDGVARSADQRVVRLPYGLAFESSSSSAPLPAVPSSILDSRLLARRTFSNPVLLTARLRTAHVSENWEVGRPGFGSPGRLDRVSFSCAACHVGRVAVGGRIQFLPGMPNTEIAPSSLAKLLMLTGAALLNAGFDPASNAPINPAALQPNIPAIQALYGEMIDKARQRPASLYGPSPSQIARAKEQALAVADNFPSIMQDLMALAVKTHFAYQVFAKNNAYKRLPPGVGDQRQGQMDLFGIAPAYVAVHTRRPDASFMEFVNRDFPSELSFAVAAPKELGDRIMRDVSGWAPSVPGVIDLPSVVWTVDRHHAGWDASQAPAFAAFLSGTFTAGDPRTANVRIYEPMTPFMSHLPPPPYPFAVDLRRAREGKELFRAKCATCHHARNETVYSASKLRVDANRAKVTTRVSRYFLAALASESCRIYALGQQPASDSAWCLPEGEWQSRLDGYFRDTPQRVAQGTEGYKADMLHGIWAQAPYLHNGSVPTLGQLLCGAARPRRFVRGNLNYDEALVGFEWSVRPQRYGPDDTVLATEYDTSIEGNANSGHDYGAEQCPDLGGLDSVRDRKEIESRIIRSPIGALLAYLKTL